jgi:5-formyltetrahydrofolate cyclo-ligase
MLPGVSPKSELRAHIRSARRALADATRTAFDAALTSSALDLVRTSGALSVAAYMPLAFEPGGALLIPALASAVPRLLLPVLRDDLDLDWAAHDGTFAEGRFGLVQPAGPRLGPDAVASVDLMLVPGLAMAPDGTRLGQGGGSYDRVLPQVTAPTIVLLYPGELLTSLPAEPHDQRVCGALMGYESAHLHWTKGCRVEHHWHSKYQSANDGG